MQNSQVLLVDLNQKMQCHEWFFLRGKTCMPLLLVASLPGSLELSGRGRVWWLFILHLRSWNLEMFVIKINFMKLKSRNGNTQIKYRHLKFALCTALVFYHHSERDRNVGMYTCIMFAPPSPILSLLSQDICPRVRQRQHESWMTRCTSH